MLNDLRYSLRQFRRVPLLVAAMCRWCGSSAHGCSTSSLVSATALLAGFVPAWRASRVDPMIALRAE